MLWDTDNAFKPLTVESHIAQLNIHNGKKFSFLSATNQLRNSTSKRMIQYEGKLIFLFI